MKSRTSVSSSCGRVSMAVDSVCGPPPGRIAFATAASRFAANVVGHSPEGDLCQPCAGIVREALARPLHCGGQRRLLNGVLGRREIAKSSDNGAEHLRRQFPQKVLDRKLQRACCHSNSSGGPLMTCRTSMGMVPGVAPAPWRGGWAPPKPARRS